MYLKINNYHIVYTKNIKHCFVTKNIVNILSEFRNYYYEMCKIKKYFFH